MCHENIEIAQQWVLQQAEYSLCYKCKRTSINMILSMISNTGQRFIHIFIDLLESLKCCPWNNYND